MQLLKGPENDGTLRRWMVAGPGIARIVTELEDHAIGTRIIDDDHGQHEQHSGVQADFLNDVITLTAVMKKANISWFWTTVADRLNNWQGTV
jgi:hypothetical protein